jgi:hypothetical protein
MDAFLGALVLFADVLHVAAWVNGGVEPAPREFTPVPRRNWWSPENPELRRQRLR